MPIMEMYATGVDHCSIATNVKACLMFVIAHWLVPVCSAAWALFDIQSQMTSACLKDFFSLSAQSTTGT